MFSVYFQHAPHLFLNTLFVQKNCCFNKTLILFQAQTTLTKGQPRKEDEPGSHTPSIPTPYGNYFWWKYLLRAPVRFAICTATEAPNHLRLQPPTHSTHTDGHMWSQCSIFSLAGGWEARAGLEGLSTHLHNVSAVFCGSRFCLIRTSNLPFILPILLVRSGWREFDWIYWELGSHLVGSLN